MHIKINIEEFDDLPIRAKHVIEFLGGLEKTEQYYISKKSFEAIPKSGLKTNLELCSYFENKLSGNIRQFKIYNEIIKRPINLIECIDYYLSEKDKTTKRVKHFLISLEFEENFDHCLNNQKEFIKKYFLNKYNFKSKNLIGERGLFELEKIKKGIEKVVVYSDNINGQNIFENEMVHSIYIALSYIVSKKEINECIIKNGEYYYFPLILANYLINSNIHPTSKLIFERYYFSRLPFSKHEIAKKEKISTERVRQILAQLNNEIIPNTIELIKNCLYEFKNEVSFFENANILSIEPQKSISCIFKHLKENNEYYIKVYSHLLSSNYIEINALIQDSTLKSFVKTDDNKFVSLNYLKRISFRILLSWIDNEIYNFELNEFSYNLEILIKRFYNEHQIFIENEDLSDCVYLISITRRTDWSKIQDKIQKNRKNSKNEDILNAVEDFINQSNKTQKTSTILEYLNTTFFEITKPQLLKLLGTHKSRFGIVGSGHWGTPNVIHQSTGTLRSIIFSKLEKMSSPIHISALMEIVNEFHPTNEKSIFANLKMEENGVFVFLNCGFIGLKEKRYDSYWYNLPKINGLMFAKRILKGENLNSQDIIETVSKKYGYPEIHVRYLLSKKLK